MWRRSWISVRFGLPRHQGSIRYLSGVRLVGTGWQILSEYSGAGRQGAGSAEFHINELEPPPGFLAQGNDFRFDLPLSVFTHISTGSTKSGWLQELEAPSFKAKTVSALHGGGHFAIDAQVRSETDAPSFRKGRDNAGARRSPGCLSLSTAGRWSPTDVFQAEGTGSSKYRHGVLD